MVESGGTASDQWPTPGQGTSPRAQAEEKVMQQLQMTHEELSVLKECNRESFWYRCLPLSIIGMTATQLAVKRGILLPHPKYGGLLKCVAAGLAGFVIGKLSYTRVCKEKLMQLENSPLAESLRRQKYGGAYPGSTSRENDDQSAPFTEAEPSTKGPAKDYSSNLAIGSSDYHQRKGLDDTHRPNLDNIPEQPHGVSDVARQPGDRPATEPSSYDELRRRNREEYNRRVQQTTTPAARQPSPTPPPPSQPRGYHDSDNPGSSAGQKKSGAKNKYGDTLED